MRLSKLYPKNFTGGKVGNPHWQPGCPPTNPYQDPKLYLELLFAKKKKTMREYQAKAKELGLLDPGCTAYVSKWPEIADLCAAASRQLSGVKRA
jgi:hypothetical protein